jgi:hypothetical protein
MSVISAVNYFDIPTGNQNLAQTLTNGNDGAGQSIRGINDVSLNTINGSTYPPVVSTPTISQVLSAGYVAGSSQQLIGLAKLGATDVSLNTINGSTYPPVVSTPNIASVLSAGSVASSQTLTGLTSLTSTNVNLDTINETTYPPVVSTPTISQVLTAGSDAGSKGITSVGALTGVSTINSISYPPPVTIYTQAGSSDIVNINSGEYYSLLLFGGGTAPGYTPAKGTWLFTGNFEMSGLSITQMFANLYAGPQSYLYVIGSSGITMTSGSVNVFDFSFAVVFTTDGDKSLSILFYQVSSSVASLVNRGYSLVKLA